MQTNKYQELKIRNNAHHQVQDHLVVAAPLQININNTPYTVVMRTLEDNIDLVRGLLYAEDIYKKETDPLMPILKKQDQVPSVIHMTIPKSDLGKGYLNKRTLLSVSSCGICGKQELEDMTLKNNHHHHKKQ